MPGWHQMYYTTIVCLPLILAGKEEGKREGQVEGPTRRLGRRGGRGSRAEAAEPVLLRREGDADHEQRHEGG